MTKAQQKVKENIKKINDEGKARLRRVPLAPRGR
jgi:hypothetical protein